MARVLGPVGQLANRGDDGFDRVEYDFLISVGGDLSRPRLEPGKHTEWRWTGEADLHLFDNHRARCDLRVCRIVAAGFVRARALGLDPWSRP